MRLLVLTQKVNIKDDILGFFHRWIIEFAKHVESLTVICLFEGEHDLPPNVKVLSLGKETGESRIKYLMRFYKYIWEERKSYDSVFVHMNQEYLLLGVFLWKLLGKSVSLWRNHPLGNFLTDIAVVLADKLFCTSSFSYIAKSKKTILMPVGIDTDYFKKNTEANNSSILYLGRISSIKNVDIMVDVLNDIHKTGIDFHAEICGGPGKGDESYFNKIKESASPLIIAGKLNFLGSVSNNETVSIFSRNKIGINLTPSGSFDKSILEHMSCDGLVLTRNESVAGMLPEELKQILIYRSSSELQERLLHLLSLDEVAAKRIGEELRKVVIKKHSLRRLGSKLMKELC